MQGLSNLLYWFDFGFGFGVVSNLPRIWHHARSFFCLINIYCWGCADSSIRHAHRYQQSSLQPTSYPETLFKPRRGLSFSFTSNYWNHPTPSLINPSWITNLSYPKNQPISASPKRLATLLLYNVPLVYRQSRRFEHGRCTRTYCRACL
jgi:hypothetical protein